MAVLQEVDDPRPFPRVRDGKTGAILYGRPSDAMMQASDEFAQYGQYAAAVFDGIEWCLALRGVHGRQIWVETDPNAVSCPELAVQAPFTPADR